MPRYTKHKRSWRMLVLVIAQSSKNLGESVIVRTALNSYLVVLSTFNLDIKHSSFMVDA